MADAHGEPWPEQPDSWEEADRAWAEGQGESEEPAAGPPRPAVDPADSPVEAYARGMTEAGPYLGLGFQIAGSMALFTAGGYFVDRALGTSPWGIILGAALAFVGILFLVVRLGKMEDDRRRGKG